MRKYISFIFIALLTISNVSFAQSPGGVSGGLRLWLDASDNSTLYTDTACTPGNEGTITIGGLTNGQLYDVFGILIEYEDLFGIL